MKSNMANLYASDDKDLTYHAVASTGRLQRGPAEVKTCLMKSELPLEWLLTLAEGG